ncbi:MAG: HAMP domain-containing sensor histidine kinase [Candidatus Binatia bacterium]
MLLARVRLAAGVVLPSTLALSAYNITTDSGTQSLRTLVVLPFLCTATVGWAAARTPSLARHGRAVALAFLLLLASSAILSWSAIPQDFHVVPIYLLTFMTGSTLIFPWGALPQGILCAVLFVGYVVAAQHAPGQLRAAALVETATMVPVVLVGAGAIERSRRAIFERAWEKDQLVSLARDLADRVEADGVLRAVLEHGVRLLAVDWASALLLEPGRGTYRVAAIAGRNTDPSWLGFEVPANLSNMRAVIEHGTLTLPEDAPGSPAIRVLHDQGTQHALYVLLRHGGDVLGVLSFGRERDARFRTTERRLAAAIADQASLALRTAHLVTDLRRASQLKSEFVSTISHELRTPLNVILGYAEMARDGSATGLQMSECLSRIEDAGRELLGLIESTLEIGRLEANRDEVRLETVPLPAFWAEMQEACSRIPHAPAVALEWRTPVAPVVLRTDPRKLTIILRNLVGNALKFTEHGRVRVDALVDAAGVHLRVSDTGIGIRREDQQSVFEMFRQADGSDSRRYGGSGLGLYIVRRFVGQLGGTIDLDSAPGHGSTFTVTLPASAAAAADAA